MEVKKLYMTFLFLLCFGLWGQAQNRYAVHFKYKPQEKFSLANPADFLSPMAVERKARFSVELDSLDLPVSEKYIETIKPFVVEILYHSHWLNASLVIANPEMIEQVMDLDIVEDVILAAPGFVPQGRVGSKSNEKAGFNIHLKTKNSKSTEAPFEFQNQLLGIQEMHEEGFRGKGVTVAVFDAGFPGVNTIPTLSHIVENGKLLGGKNFVHPWDKDIFKYNQHGSNVLSLIASNDPETLVAGAPDANFILCITEEVPTEYRIEEYNWVKAAEYADSLGVDIINSSLGYLDFDDKEMDYTFEDLDGETALITKGANIASEKGILVVTSVGNYGSRGLSSLTAPADGKGVLSIGSVNGNLDRSGFSSQGPTSDGRFKPELTTNGEQVWLMRSNGNLGRANGTSFSAPQIAALAAGLWEAKPDWNKDQLLEALYRSASNFEDPDNFLGYGIPNFTKAYLGEILNIITVEEEKSWKIFPNPISGNSLFVNFGDLYQGEFSLFDMHGKVLQQLTVSRDSLQEPFQIQIPTLNNGMYIVEMHSGKDVRRTKLLKK
ncbi:Subtilisin-like serine protease [Indibacter alkaliphilus LW1]|uniref:Subtilisin-like serine protease n=1 Tax=Indibacter alkaliphilus (strain CCUG 57479 / KCTC 22604 / LW1) TaxID=1189612 RepID=S2D9M6_INDAL|nr:S8 family serine peptidase [Indibacter alkaliphilus]EOZ93690.1 Subtilisin-like serine protease [Indibacter alkaliphilus LW1]